MGLSNVSPFRQIKHAYSAILNISNVMSSVPEAIKTNIPVAPDLDAVTTAITTAITTSLGQTRSTLETIGKSVEARSDSTEIALHLIKEAVLRIREPDPVYIQVEPPIKQVDLYDRMGFSLMLDRASLVDRAVIDTGSWEPEQVTFFTDLANVYRGQKNNVFLDIGAYWGLYSLLFNRTQIFDRIFTFEADAHNFGQLQTQLFLNRAAHKVRAFNKAVSSENHVMHVWDSTSHPDGNRAGVGIVYEGFKNATHPIDAVTVDSFLALSDSNLAIKIDVEGHEQMVLPGMAKTFKENRVIMQIEIYEEQADVVFPILETLGLRRFHQIDHDFYFTNMSKDALGH